MHRYKYFLTPFVVSLFLTFWKYYALYFAEYSSGKSSVFTNEQGHQLMNIAITLSWSLTTVSFIMTMVFSYAREPVAASQPTQAPPAQDQV